MSFEDALRDLRERFVRGSDERLALIEQLLELLEADPADERTLRDVMIQFHGFSGAGSTYGFPGVSALGKEGERHCDALLREKVQPGARQIQRWRLLLESLRRELRGEPAPTSADTAPHAPVRASFDILIVDSDPGIRDSMKDLAARRGISTRGAASREEALTELSRRTADGLIVDVRLPDGSGSELVEHARSLPAGESLAILMVGEPSAFVNRVDAIHCGADGYFDKPLQLDALMRRLEHLLERSRTEPPRVLSVEDDPDQAAFVSAVLESAGYRVRICADAKNLETELSAFRPDLVLLDIQLPGTDGYSLARYIRQQEAHAALPILFLTTKSHIESQIESLRAGGDDYLVKPVAPGLLLSSAAGRIERARFLRNLLERDGLTRLLTHTAFLERARAVISEKARNPGTPVAMMVLDLDGFKPLNDRFGHPVGDTVLCSLAGLLRRRLRQSDHLGRLGGDEFAAIIENIGGNQAVRLLERMREEFSALDQVATDGTVFHATFSAGVAVLEPNMDAGLWRERADAALYAAKSRGRNRVAGAAG
ncbi:MAG TPA: response regulator [Thermoanaerobaculia bacterium]|nr:response regulator [Thermoanaerobaculia bacterium]